MGKCVMSAIKWEASGAFTENIYIMLYIIYVQERILEEKWTKLSAGWKKKLKKKFHRERLWERGREMYVFVCNAL